MWIWLERIELKRVLIEKEAPIVLTGLDAGIFFCIHIAGY